MRLGLFYYLSAILCKSRRAKRKPGAFFSSSIINIKLHAHRHGNNLDVGRTARVFRTRAALFEECVERKSPNSILHNITTHNTSEISQNGRNRQGATSAHGTEITTKPRVCSRGLLLTGRQDASDYNRQKLDYVFASVSFIK